MIVFLLQDISFFDNETVGDLTSRLGADCQQVSRVIGNDLNLIFRNLLQVPILIAMLTPLVFVCNLRCKFDYPLYSSGVGCNDLLANLVMASWFMHIDDMLYFRSSYATLWPVRYSQVSLDILL